jgi:hypothetical protein
MKLLVQEFLETHTLKELQEMHGVYASVSKNNRKISLNYDQIEAKENDPLSQDCRGLILAKSEFSEFAMSNSKLDNNVVIGETQIVAFGMRRFFNYGQGAAANINWSDPNLAVLEKLDGTLCIVYYDFFISKWCVATRSVPEADLLMDNGIFTFRTLFEKAFQETVENKVKGIYYGGFEYFLDGNFSKNFTYCFELTTPYNRIVVNYSNNRVTLLFARHMPNLQELSLTHNMVAPLSRDIPFVKAYTYSSTEELLNWVSSLNPMDHEGVVVLDSNFNRIKVKNAAYVAYNKLHDKLGSSERNCMEFILLEKDDDVKSFLPEEIVKNMEILKVGLQNALAKYDSAYSDIQLNMKALGESATKKDFALMVNKHTELWSAPFFQIYAGKASSMKDFIQKSRKDGTWVDSFLDKILDLSKKNV